MYRSHFWFRVSKEIDKIRIRQLFVSIMGEQQFRLLLKYETKLEIPYEIKASRLSHP